MTGLYFAPGYGMQEDYGKVYLLRQTSEVFTSQENGWPVVSTVGLMGRKQDYHFKVQ